MNPKQPTSPSWQFRIFYDGGCPLCMREMRFLMGHARAINLDFVNTAAAGFSAADYGISSDPGRLIHGMLPDGKIVVGLEVFRRAYAALGLGWLWALTGWPVLKPCFDFGYRIFARYRIPLGRLLGRKCADDTCGV